jgi:hypothetical protein
MSCRFDRRWEALSVVFIVRLIHRSFAYRRMVGLVELVLDFLVGHNYVAVIEPHSS